MTNLEIIKALIAVYHQFWKNKGGGGPGGGGVGMDLKGGKKEGEGENLDTQAFSAWAYQSITTFRKENYHYAEAFDHWFAQS
jgi:hypothetical protein